MTTGAKKSKKKSRRLNIDDLLKGIEGKSHEELWGDLEENMVEFYCEHTGVKKENVSPETRRGIAAGYAYAMGHTGNALATDPMSIMHYCSPDNLILSALYVIDKRLKKSIGN